MKRSWLHYYGKSCPENPCLDVVEINVPWMKNGKEGKAFQLTFNGWLKVDFQRSAIASDGGLILVNCLRESIGMTDVAGGVGVFPAERLGVFRIGVDVAAELAGEVGRGGEHAAGNDVALQLRARISILAVVGQNYVAVWIEALAPKLT